MDDITAHVVRGKATQTAQDNKEQADHAHNLMTLQVGLCLLSCVFAAAPSLIDHVR